MHLADTCLSAVSLHVISQVLLKAGQHKLDYCIGLVQCAMSSDSESHCMQRYHFKRQIVRDGQLLSLAQRAAQVEAQSDHTYRCTM